MGINGVSVGEAMYVFIHDTIIISNLVRGIEMDSILKLSNINRQNCRYSCSLLCWQFTVTLWRENVFPVTNDPVDLQFDVKLQTDSGMLSKLINEINGMLRGSYCLSIFFLNNWYDCLSILKYGVCLWVGKVWTQLRFRYSYIT